MIEEKTSRYWGELKNPSRPSTHGRGHRWVWVLEFGELFCFATLERRFPVRRRMRLPWDTVAMCVTKSGGKLRVPCALKGPMWDQDRTLLLKVKDSKSELFAWLSDPEPFPEHGMTWP